MKNITVKFKEDEYYEIYAGIVGVDFLLFFA